MTNDDLLYRHRLQLFARAGQVGVSRACQELGYHRSWYYRWKPVVRYLLPFQTSLGGMSPDGSMWTVNNDRAGVSTRRLIRAAVNGTLDRSATLPSTAGTVFGGSPLAAATDGAIWTVAVSGNQTNLVRFQPT